MGNPKPKIQKINGTCTTCGASLGKTAMKKHLVSCKRPVRKRSSYLIPLKTKVFTILVEGRFMHEYWMYLEVPANSMLKKLDNFLRYAWVECCGHLSQFTIDDEGYISEIDYLFDSKEKSMNYVINKVLSVGKKFSYEYDFGSPTYLNLKVLSEHEIEGEESSISLLARNEPPSVTCNSCGKTATYICAQCGYSGEGWVCEECASDHKCGEEMLLPVVNSPRVGVCGYTGNY
jgi:predicted RNA-binding Zn-ribbon protein involved in translation (DUF1610 family)